jgi:hypothetical protein
MTSRSEYVTSEGCMRRFLACGITFTWQYRNFRGTSISTHSPALGVCGRAGAYRGREGRAIDKSITGLLIHRLLPTLQNPIVSEVKIRAPNLVRRRAWHVAELPCGSVTLGTSGPLHQSQSGRLGSSSFLSLGRDKGTEKEEEFLLSGFWLLQSLS